MPNNRPYQRRSFSGRLASLPTTSVQGVPFLLKGGAVQGNAPGGIVIIDFPSMPETIDLVRRSTYNVASLYTSPDGFHIYSATEPLRIPFSFKLHSQDQEYCTQGGLTLLHIAARLHSLQLPLSDPSEYALRYVSRMAPIADNSRSEGVLAIESEQVRKSIVNSRLSVLPPVPVILDLIRTVDDGPGIVSIGYVEDVSVKLFGPFLTPPASLGGYNIPSAAEYSFTFVHHPAHSNDPENRRSNVHAYAQDVRDRLYNTADLVYADGSTEYVTRGF